MTPSVLQAEMWQRGDGGTPKPERLKVYPKMKKVGRKKQNFSKGLRSRKSCRDTAHLYQERSSRAAQCHQLFQCWKDDEESCL